MTDKEDIINKIKSMLDKNTKNGATVEETVASITKAKKMMEKYQITIDDIKNNKIKKEDFVFNYDKMSKKVSSIEYIIANVVAEYTETKCFSYKFGKNNNKMVFFGLKQDVELALYIVQNCENSAHYSWKMYREINNCDLKYKKAFYIGFCQKIKERLNEIIKERNNHDVTHGNQLIVLKNQLVEQNFNEKTNNAKMKQNSPVLYHTNEHATQEGYKAGDKAILFKQTEDKKNLMIDKV